MQTSYYVHIALNYQILGGSLDLVLLLLAVETDRLVSACQLESNQRRLRNGQVHPEKGREGGEGII